MNKTPRGNRLHIALLGRTNVGKSSFLNMITGQDVSIISSIPGTTTDVVEKAMELLPIGPVLFLDTAGFDDKSTLANLRLKKTYNVFNRADVAVLLLEPEVWTDYEEEILKETQKREIPLIAIINKIDLKEPSNNFINQLRSRIGQVVIISALDKKNRDNYVNAFKTQLLKICPPDFLQPPPLIGDLLPPSGLAVLVVPIDLEAPKGRLILPQVQTIRDTLDNDAAALVVKERELAHILNILKIKPNIVVCDSQVVLKMCADTPKGIPATTFSILFSRYKGDLIEQAKGAAHIEALKTGDKVLIAEGCTHHPIEDDIGRVKIPRWLRQFVGSDLQIDFYAGRDYPDNLGEYKLVIHCGACTLNRREMLERIQMAKEVGVPITNYGISISLLQGVLKRTLSPFPAALIAFEKELEKIKCH
ncbi:small GTP-binding protein [Thermodesulfobium narugense DSM 14796]|uniref:Small GTP-binding protein n=1 Tax=Thermodesulfobium narugense DSM 14796 TaxID=747365 RepID=M1E9D8_9BACT|nr:[FeFe] hydrogenase H-cluster maturation GTPase HydF [Thermodesulfobium narugense]AEE15124.1 small GTP-binding protein [Thermodesulfobium narugense DSM 14796]